MGRKGADSSSVAARTPAEADRFVVPDNRQARALFGPFDENLRLIEGEIPVSVVSRGNEVAVTGEAAHRQTVVRVLELLLDDVRRGHSPGRLEVRQAIRDSAHDFAPLPADTVVTTARGKPIRPKSDGQRAYVDAIKGNDIAFGIGPAGTGKTYLAMAMAVTAFKAHEVSRIILTRPAVEAGEKLGFLPGDLQEKVDPYLRPLYDALHDMVSPDTIPKLMAAGTIEVAPLAYMRGRSLNDAFIILDEAQNTSAEQMKMFLTRLGFGSKMVVTGDVTQVDLPGGTQSGLRVVQEILTDLDDVAFCRLTSHDVVRHRLVSAIVDAYGRYEAGRPQRSDASPGRGRGRRGSK